MRYNHQGDTTKMSIYNETDPLDKQIRGDEPKRLTSASTFLYTARSQNGIQRKPGKQLTELIAQDQVFLMLLREENKEEQVSGQRVEPECKVLRNPENNSAHILLS